LRKFTVIFFDDILIYSDSLSAHITHLEVVLKTLLNAKLFLKRSKCLFAQRQLEYLGHIISGNSIEPESSKIAAMVQWPTPSCQKDLWTFLGLTRFYRHFIKGYAQMASPLTSMLCRNNFLWSSQAQLSFDNLKQAMTKAPVLTAPDFSLPFVVETDASEFAMGTILMQQNRPIALFNQ